jgi:ribosome maturation factor RimP
MDATAGRVRALLEPLVEAAGLVLDDVVVHRAGAHSLVRVVVDLPEDDPGELDLDRVASATSAISDALDEADLVTVAYQLEVSSPGVDRPLTAHRHFVRARGRLVTLTLQDGRTLAGRLTEVGPQEVVVLPSSTPGKGRRPVEQPPVRVRLDEVTVGRVEVDLTGLGHLDEDEEN